jgi:uncharacterized protein YqjF (DUF2071 family)
MPGGPWLMTQTWRELLFAHWRSDPDRLRARIPKGLDLDLFHGQAWIGIVPFSMSNVGPRALSALPALPAFPEINVRTYVHVRGKRGVYFFSLDASSVVAVLGARLGFYLPYFLASMNVDARDGDVRYQSRRRAVRGHRAAFAAVYRPSGCELHAQPGSLEYFLTERYCLYTHDARGRTCIAEIHHPPWSLQPATAEISVNTRAEAAGLSLAPTPPLLHFARRQDVVVWPLRWIEPLTDRNTL